MQPHEVVAAGGFEAYGAAFEHHLRERVAGERPDIEGRAQHPDRQLAGLHDEGMPRIVRHVEIGLAVEPHDPLPVPLAYGIAQLGAVLQPHLRPVLQMQDGHVAGMVGIGLEPPGFRQAQPCQPGCRDRDHDHGCRSRCGHPTPPCEPRGALHGVVGVDTRVEPP